MQEPNVQPTGDDLVELWPVIENEARVLREKEPFLDAFISHLIPVDGTLAYALAARLTDLLLAPGVEPATLKRLLVDCMATDLSIEALALADLKAVRERDPSCQTYLHPLLNFKGFQAIVAHRIAHFLWMNARRDLAAWLSNRVSLVLGPDIHPAARLGSGIMLDHGSGIVIGETAVVSDNVSILQNVTLGGTGKIHGDRHPTVHEGVMIGAGAKILGNVEIGAFSKIAAGSVVLKAVPPGCTVAGIPAQIVRIHATSEVPAKLMDQNL